MTYAILETLQALSEDRDGRSASLTHCVIIYSYLNYCCIECLKSLWFPELNLRRKGVETAADNTCTWLPYQILPPHLCSNDERNAESEYAPIIVRHITQRNLYAMNPEKYSKWIDTGGLLWINGKAGSGKSVLMKQAIKDAEKWSKKSKNVVVLDFFFNGRGNITERLPTSLFRTLLWQLANHFRDNLSIIALMVEEYRVRKSTEGEIIWHIEDLKELFTRTCALAEAAEIIVFLDAFDKMEPELHYSALEIVRYLDKIAKMGRMEGSFKLSVCFSSRPIPSIETWWPRSYPQFCMQDENEEDIKTYINHVLDSLRDHHRLGLDLISVARGIAAKADGVFLWVTLVMKRVLADVQHATQDELEGRLRDIPAELSDLYRQMMQRIEPAKKPEALRMAMIVLFAKYPLTITEFRIACSAIHNPRFESLEAMELASDIVKTDLQMLRRLRDYTEGLLEVKPSTLEDELSGQNLGDRRVQVLHQFVIDFFLKKGGLRILQDDAYEGLEEKAHGLILEACINAISMAASSQMNESRPARPFYTFLYYADRCWNKHASQSSGTAQKLAMDQFLDNSGQVFLHWRKHWNRPPSHLSNMDNLDQASLLHVVTYFGLAACAKYLIENCQFNVDTVGSVMRTPLGIALAMGNDEMIRLLLDRGGKVSSTGGVYSNLLQIMAAYGMFKPFRRLINLGADIHEKGGAYGTILNAVLCGGKITGYRRYHDERLNMVRTLLDRDPQLALHDYLRIHHNGSRSS